MKTKYIILVGDGMADFPIPELGNRTPLEYASTPNMDRIAKEGVVGEVSTVPKGFTPGSDVANLSLMGYDPFRFYSGRAPIEAASMGIQLQSDETAFRCNLVTIDNRIMKDYSCGHIDTPTAHSLIKELKEKFDSPTQRFFPGVGYRHLFIVKNFPEGLTCTPPHDITDKKIDEYLPRGAGDTEIISLMQSAREILAESRTNADRKARGLSPATDIWLWGQGHAITLPPLKQRYGIEGSVISAVDLVRGLGILAGLKVRLVEGATGYLGTNYAGKIAAARNALENEDFVYLHIEAPDETSHEGSLQKKILAIEEFDRNIVSEVLRLQEERGDLRILVAPDHATPVSLKTHSGGAVPFAVCGPAIKSSGVDGYCEKTARGYEVITGPILFDKFLKGSF